MRLNISKNLTIVVLSLMVLACAGRPEPLRANMTGPTVAAPLVPVYTKYALNTSIAQAPIAFILPQPLQLSDGTVAPADALLEGYYDARGNQVFFAPAFVSFYDEQRQLKRVAINSYQTARIDLRTDGFKYGEKAGKGAAIGGALGALAGGLEHGWMGALIGAGVGAAGGAAIGASGEWWNNNKEKQLPPQTGMILSFK